MKTFFRKCELKEMSGSLNVKWIVVCIKKTMGSLDYSKCFDLCTLCSQTKHLKSLSDPVLLIDTKEYILALLAPLWNTFEY